MRKEAGWHWYHSIGLALSCYHGNFQTNLYWSHPVRGLKLLREPCFCHLKAIIVSQCRRLMKKSGKLACHVVNSNIAIGSLPTLQISLGMVALFEKIYYKVPILNVFSNIGEDVRVQYRCFNSEFAEKF
jgi:hypothetical protein